MDHPISSITKYKKTINVSLWGNIHESNQFELINDGVKLSGEFSNVDMKFNDPNQMKHIIKFLRTNLPAELSGLSISDEIGNVTKPKAFHKEDNIELILIPRFPLFGGWKSNFNIEFNQKTTRYLFQSLKGSPVYKLEYKFDPLFD